MQGIKITHWGEDYATLEIAGQEYETTNLALARAIEAEQQKEVKRARKNVALALDALVHMIDADGLGSDGNASGEPAFQWDFKTPDATHRVYLTSK